MCYLSFRKNGQPVKSENNQVKTSSSEINLNLHQQQDPSTMPVSMLCKVCCKEKLEVLLVSCRHVASCIQCAKNLDQCPVCKLKLFKTLNVYVHVNGKKDEDLDQLPCSSSRCSDEPLDPMLCNVCHTEKMGAV